MSERYEEAARLYESAVEELELAARHCRTTAGHFRAGDVPRAAAHAWAARGHLLAAEEALDAQAREHTRRSEP
ncbi:MAG TPA: hypothetical protein VEY87_09500 [Gaiellaceae bacterium]|nr:hypothetical protein [Gaiellaceae bacterium]